MFAESLIEVQSFLREKEVKKKIESSDLEISDDID